MFSSPSLIPNLIAAGLYLAATLYQGSHLAQGRKADKRLLGLLGALAVIAQGGALFFQLITPLGLSLDFFSAASLIAAAVILLTLLACRQIPVENLLLLLLAGSVFAFIQLQFWWTQLSPKWQGLEWSWNMFRKLTGWCRLDRLQPVLMYR